MTSSTKDINAMITVWLHALKSMFTFIGFFHAIIKLGIFMTENITSIIHSFFSVLTEETSDILVVTMLYIVIFVIAVNITNVIQIHNIEKNASLDPIIKFPFKKFPSFLINRFFNFIQSFI